MKFYFLADINMSNLLKTVAIVTALATSPTTADTPNINSASHMAVSGESIDFKSKIASIDKQIVQIQTKISIIEEKSELTSSDKRVRYTLNKELKKLTAEKLVIKQSEGQQLDETVATKQTEGQQLDKKLDIAEQKLAALNRVSNILTSQKSQ